MRGWGDCASYPQSPTISECNLPAAEEQACSVRQEETCHKSRGTVDQVAAVFLEAGWSEHRVEKVPVPTGAENASGATERTVAEGLGR